MWNDDFDQFVRIIRFDNLGFTTKPYNSTWEVCPHHNAYCHGFEFLDIKVTDLYAAELKLPIECKVTKPAINDFNWSGCFVFLEEYDPRLLNREGALSFRENHKKNKTFMSKNEVIWVRNSNFKGETVYQYSQYTSEHEGQTYYFSKPLNKRNWVQMSVHDALERARLGKLHYGYFPEELTEAFLMEKQVQSLLPVPKDYPYTSIKDFIKSVYTRKEERT